jgi:predicted RNase H-like nuclease (RuvC/YqgF family)
LTCHKPIKLSKIDNAGPNARKKWERFELDGVTPHQCKKQEQEQEATAPTTPMTVVSQVENGPSEIAELSNQVRDLKETVSILISQIQGLRSEVKQKNK